MRRRADWERAAQLEEGAKLRKPLAAASLAFATASGIFMSTFLLIIKSSSTKPSTMERKNAAEWDLHRRPSGGNPNKDTDDGRQTATKPGKGKGKVIQPGTGASSSKRKTSNPMIDRSQRGNRKPQNPGQ